ncbi:MAG: DNA repair protein RecN [Chitinispirillaceae bacterium]
MIRDLRIKNLALIEDLTLEFRNGFTVFTGETGAGKSILIGAIGLLLGERASSEMIRSGKEEAEVSGVMEIRSFRSRLENFLAESGIEAEDGCIIIRRKLSRNGKNRVRINQIPVPLSTLRRLGDMLIDLHGQHQHQSLLDETTHVRILNTLPGVKEPADTYNQTYRNYLKAQELLKSERKKAKELADKRDILEFQLKELKTLNAQKGEEEELEEELNLLSSSAERIACANDILETMNSGNGETLQKKLSHIKRKLEAFSKYDTSIQPWVNDIDGVISICSELDLFCATYLQQIGTSSNQNRIEEINSRLAKIQRLKKKYVCDLDELIQRKENIQNDLDSISNSDAQLDLLESEQKKAREACMSAAHKLTQARIKAADEFDEKISGRMNRLGFKDGLWKTDLRKTSEPGREGLETVHFLVRTNPGEPFLPLAKTASGGEISRLMLAVKSILAENDEIPVLIFDEIDTGIGGVLAGEVSKALYALSNTHQVLCISHLHQIASSADHHYKVTKSVSGGRTVTLVESLDDSRRVDEIARMLGGESDISRKHAEEFLKKNRNYKETV